MCTYVNAHMYMYICSDAQSCLTLSDSMDCSLPGSSIHGIFQARVLEWGAISALLTMPKPLTVWITKSCGKFFNRWEYQATLPAS